MRQPQMPRPHPCWSFLYCHHGLSVSVALMRRPRCGELIKATSSHQRLPGDGTSKFSLRRSFLGGALISDKVQEQEGPSPSQWPTLQLLRSLSTWFPLSPLVSFQISPSRPTNSLKTQSLLSSASSPAQGQETLLLLSISCQDPEVIEGKIMEIKLFLDFLWWHNALPCYISLHTNTEMHHLRETEWVLHQSQTTWV